MLTFDENFFSALPINRMPLGGLLIRDDLFQNVPNGWHIIITDIKGSTKAVATGMHENVNLIATGSIVTVLNITFKANILIPFFFGGDGATFIVPPSVIENVLEALNLYKANTLTNFDLDLRVGTLPVENIYQNGQKLLLSRFRVSEAFSIPVVLGNGLVYAEALIKGDDYRLSLTKTLEDELDLTGMQCRWDRIAPPENTEEIVTLLVVPLSMESQATVLGKIMNHIDAIYGLPQERQPISVGKLKLNTTFHKIGVEMRARFGKISFFKLLENWFTTLYGHIYFRTQTGKNYLEGLVKMSDTLVIDGKINTVISGTAKQRAALVEELDKIEKAGQAAYGLHVSRDTIMSCYVRDLKDGHIHFVDGSEGGYTRAATMVKEKIKQG